VASESHAVKLALAQFNPTVGALTDNVARMRAWIAEAHAAGSDLVLFPELALVGYPPRDLVERQSFVQAVQARTAELVRSVPAGLTVVFGSIGLASGRRGPPLTNDAVVASGGVEVARVSKQLLPTYDVFDEARHFQPGDHTAIIRCGSASVALSICEDAWAETEWFSARYLNNPLAALQGRSPDLLLNLSASPFTLSKWGARDELFRQIALRHGVAVAVANQVGANDEILFDGSSLLWSKAGQLLARAPSFEEALVYADLERGGSIAEVASSADAALHRALVMGVRDYAKKCGFRRAVLGLSGGIDSALTAALAADALGPENVLGLAMPTRYSSPGSLADAEALAKNLGIAYRVVDIDPIFESYRASLGGLIDGLPPTSDDVTWENVQARIRGATVMAVSNRTGALVLTTGNKSEIAVGYCTLYGDMAGGLAVISDVPKTTVYKLARYINRDALRIPQSSIDKAPSAELRPDQTDQDSLPPYPELDAVLELYVEDQLSPTEIARRGHDPALVARIVRLVQRAEYKRRQAAPGLIVTRKAFGPGRRMPVARGYEEELA
jgi:NAD+ synthase (glutamine-hydrolysing)